jgi:hypothetical protein
MCFLSCFHFSLGCAEVYVLRTLVIVATVSTVAQGLDIFDTIQTAFAERDNVVW